MKKLLIAILITLFLAVTLWGIETAAAETHRIMGDSAYHTFLSEVFS